MRIILTVVKIVTVITVIDVINDDGDIGTMLKIDSATAALSNSIKSNALLSTVSQ